MDVDILLDTFAGRWTSVRDAAREAESVGFDGVWTWDHLAGSVYGAAGVLECWTTLTAIAVAVPRLAIGPLVLNVANRDPATLAVMAATLQEVSAGRLLLGLGAGAGSNTPYATEQQALGRPVLSAPARRGEVERAIHVMREVWTGEVGGVGGFLRPEPVPPLVIGGYGRKMAELAGRVGDGFNTQASHPRLAELIGVAREAGTKAGRDPDGLVVSVLTGLDERWLRHDSPERERLAAVGVDRLILIVEPPQVDQVRWAGRILTR